LDAIAAYCWTLQLRVINQSLGCVTDAVKLEILVYYIAPMAIGKSFSSVFANVPSVEEDVEPTTAPVGATYCASTQAQCRDLPISLVVGVYPGLIDTDMADGIPMDKTPPSTVAYAVMEALSNGTEDLLPDPMSQEWYENWRNDPKAMEMQMAAMIFLMKTNSHASFSLVNGLS
jgi:hypothetical protein